MSSQGPVKIRRRRTKAERRASSTADGAGDAVLGFKLKRQREWAVRQLVRKQGDACALCGERMSAVDGDPRQMTIDHIVPLARGGLDRIDNYQLACRQCNAAIPAPDVRVVEYEGLVRLFVCTGYDSRHSPPEPIWRSRYVWSLDRVDELLRRLSVSVSSSSPRRRFSEAA